MVIGICVFTLYPIIQSFYFSFYDYDYVSRFNFVGLNNYIHVFKDSQMGKVIFNTLFFAAVNIPVVMAGSYALALFLNTKMKGMKAFTVIYYLPCVIPGVVGGTIWSYLMRVSPDNPGLFNTVLRNAGLPELEFFSAENPTAILTIVMMNLWGLGGGTIMWLAQLRNIPASLYEAARIDGAGRFKQFTSITLPMSTPMLFYNMVTQVIMTLQFNGTLTFGPRAGLGNADALYMYGLKIYVEAFRRYQIGYASALSWVLIAAVGTLTAVLFKTNKWVQYDRI
jgi:ABC-type sugar transport system permease subunit